MTSALTFTDDSVSVAIGDARLTVTRWQITDEGRMQYRYVIDGAAHEMGYDLHGPVGSDPGPLEMLATLLTFLYACGEAVDFTMRTGQESENLTLFNEEVREWAYLNRDELSILECEINEREEG